MNRKSFLFTLFASFGIFNKNSAYGINENLSSAVELINRSIIDVKDFGAIGDGIKDDYKAIQKAVDFCINNKKSLYLSKPNKSYISSKKIIINGQITIFGDGMKLSGINFLKSDGFEILEGVSNVIFEKMSINQAVRNTNKENNYTGINILGENKKQPYTHVYRDVFIDGFQTAVSSNWLWDSLFDNVKILYCKTGFEVKGTSVNNIISNCSINVDGTNSKGIYFSDSKYPTEGWRISNILIFGADIGIHALFTNNVFLSIPILDFCKEYGILLEAGSGFSTNWQINGGYIAMSGKNGIAAISINNNNSNWQFRGCKICNVDILAYKGARCNYGIDLSESKDHNNVLSGNSLTNFSINNIR